MLDFFDVLFGLFADDGIGSDGSGGEGQLASLEPNELPPGLRERRQVSIREARAGQSVVIHGKLKAASQTHEAPLSGRPCIASRICIAEVARGGWRVVVRHSQAVDFFVEDSTGRVLVRADRVDVGPPEPDFELRAGSAGAAPRALKAFLKRRARVDEAAHGLLEAGRGLWAQETILQAGDVAFVLGQMRREADPDARNPGDYRTAAHRDVFLPSPEGCVVARDVIYESVAKPRPSATRRRRRRP